MKNFVKILFILISTTFFLFSEKEEIKCKFNFNNHDVQELCSLVSASLKNGYNKSTIIKQVRKFVSSKIISGSYIVSKNGKKCLRVTGYQLNIFYEDGEGVKIDEFISHGNTKTKIIDVKSCEENIKNNNNSNSFLEVSVHTFFKEINKLRIKLSPLKENLEQNESTKVSVEVLCGECKVKSKKVAFTTDNAGDVFPKTLITTGTNSDFVVFTLTKAEKSFLNAKIDNISTKLYFYPSKKNLWKIKLNIVHQNKLCKKAETNHFRKGEIYKVVNLEYKCTINNIPIHSLINALYTNFSPNSVKRAVAGWVCNAVVSGYKKELYFDYKKYEKHWAKKYISEKAKIFINLEKSSCKDYNNKAFIVINSPDNISGIVMPPIMPKPSNENSLIPCTSGIEFPIEKLEERKSFKISHSIKYGKSCKLNGELSLWSYKIELIPED